MGRQYYNNYNVLYVKSFHDSMSAIIKMKMHMK